MLNEKKKSDRIYEFKSVVVLIHRFSLASLMHIFSRSRWSDVYELSGKIVMTKVFGSDHLLSRNSSQKIKNECFKIGFSTELSVREYIQSCLDEEKNSSEDSLKVYMITHEQWDFYLLNHYQREDWISHFEEHFSQIGTVITRSESSHQKEGRWGLSWFSHNNP